VSRATKPQPTTAAGAPAGGPATWTWLALVAVGLIAYWPALTGGMLWDDNGHVTRPDLRSLAGLGRIWTEFGATQQYYPVLHSAFWLEHRLWGDATLGYHLLNVLLHATGACMFGLVLRRLAVPGATLATLLFALHPVCVESVAWISEQKNTLSLVFYLAAALAYLRFDAERRPRDYVVAGGFFVLALLTKTVTATLPAALFVVFWWRRGRLDGRRDVLPLLPWLVLGAGSGLVTAHFERVLIGAEGAGFNLSLVERCLLAGRVFWFYLGQLAWPADLIFIYPRWTVSAASPGQWLGLIAALALLGVLVWWSRRSRGPLAAGLLFAGALFPVLGFFNVYPFVFSYVADHFQYLACLPVFALAAAGCHRVLPRLPSGARPVAPGVLLAGLGILTWNQAGMYRDAVTLYETTLRKNPDCWMAHNNLANIQTLAGRPAEAVPHLEAALRLNPDLASAHNNLGDSLTRLGRAEEALPHLAKALQLQPAYAVAQGNLGIALLELNRLDEAMVHFQAALRLDPGLANVECNLGLALAQGNRPAEAIPHFARAAQLDPTYADAELNWAIGLMLTSGFPAAVPHFEKAVELSATSVDARITYGRALLQHGSYDEAIRQFEAVLRLAPDQADAHLNLALALRQLGRREEAAQHYTRALELNPALGNRSQ